MTETASEDVEPITETVHEGSWSANLERDQYETDRGLLVEHALDAVAHTASGVHVNLVTHGTHGHPEDYLYPVLDAELDADAEYEYVEQCGCGGHVTRVHVP
ncbi:CGCGG family rSAM-modified RiPP protein [Halorubellus sp. JP-L1]|uniref:CGCGG family putative rSAM-modified RiPP protein n=1 Tax=Halorubellus sp. JP-L1 TaxID=2715753 RepID=UPI00140B74B3|nr:CGCGG family rSAM-modified RiPP protein [Halorubellus sp. JP-L1]NHN42741.1 CGCGG family rSAM-modified RiPP protein [Halorubellus sp. JP-L1]